MKKYLLFFLIAMGLSSGCTSERRPSGAFEPKTHERQTDSDMYSSEAAVRESKP